MIEPTDDGFQTELWHYAGRRLGSDRKIGYLFIDAAGIERWFDKAPARAVIAGTYSVECKHLDEGRITARIQSALYIETVESEPVGEWRLVRDAPTLPSQMGGLLGARETWYAQRTDEVMARLGL